VYATVTQAGGITGQSSAQSFALSNVTDSATGGVMPANEHLLIDAGNNTPVQVTNEQIAAGNGSATEFTGYLAHSTMVPGTLTLTAGNVTGAENNGAVVGAGITYGAVTAMLHSTQVWLDIQFTSAPANGVGIYVSYKYLPAEVVQLTGAPIKNTVNAVVRNNHPQNAVVLYGGFMLGKLRGNRWAFCDALHNAFYTYGVYNIIADTHVVDDLISTTLPCGASSGSTTITVGSSSINPAGVIQPGLPLRLGCTGGSSSHNWTCGASSEKAIVQSVDGSVVTLTAGLVNSYSPGATVVCCEQQDIRDVRYASLNTNATFAPQQVLRFKGWGLNTTTSGFGLTYAQPQNNYSNASLHWSLPDHSNPQKINTFFTTFTSELSLGAVAGQAAINFFHGYDSNKPGDWYTAYHFADVYSDWWYAFLSTAANQVPSTPGEFPWLLGWQQDQTDDTPGFGRGEDFAAGGGIPAHDAYAALASAPYQAFGNGIGRHNYHVLYAGQANDTCSGLGTFPSGTNCTKKQMVTYLRTEYGTIAALNAAWGSSYSSFFSAATRYTGETVGTGSGPFTYTVAHPPISRGSVVIKVNGTPTCGDDVGGTIGPTGSCTGSSATDYSTGTISIGSITSGTVTVDYTSNGWGPECSSTALEDEDGRHTSWLGTTANYPNKNSSGTAAYRNDLHGFLLQFATYYWQKGEQALKSFAPHTLNLSEYGVGNWEIPARPEVYQGAASYVDVIGGNIAFGMRTGSYSSLSLGYQCPLNYTMAQCVFNYLGDKPIFIWTGHYANPDSAYVGLFAQDASGGQFPGFATQTQRGQYLQSNAVFNTLTNPNTGTYPFVGYTWWGYQDSNLQKYNWGLISNQDNEYDGSQATSTPGTFTIGNSTYAKFAERGDFGNLKAYFTSVSRQGNALLLSSDCGVSTSGPVVLLGGLRICR
jgi:hypothetical protein